MSSNLTLNDTPPSWVILNIHGFMLNYKLTHSNNRLNSNSNVYPYSIIWKELFSHFLSIPKKTSPINGDKTFSPIHISRKINLIHGKKWWSNKEVNMKFKLNLDFILL